MGKAGLDPEQPPRWSYDIERMEAELAGSFPDLDKSLGSLVDSLAEVRTRLENISKERRASLKGGVA